MSKRPWYPLHTRVAGYRWFDPQADNPMDHGPVIDFRVYLDPNTDATRLLYEVERAYREITHHVRNEINHASGTPGDPNGRRPRASDDQHPGDTGTSLGHT